MCTNAPSPQKKKTEGGREGWLPAVHRLSEEINRPSSPPWGDLGDLVPRIEGPLLLGP